MVQTYPRNIPGSIYMIYITVTTCDTACTNNFFKMTNFFFYRMLTTPEVLN